MAVSQYFWRKRQHKYKSFKHFIKEYFIHTPSQFKRYSINGKSVCDYHIRYEHLHEDIVELCKILNITNLTLYGRGVQTTFEYCKGYCDDRWKFCGQYFGHKD